MIDAPFFNGRRDLLGRYREAQGTYTTKKGERGEGVGSCDEVAIDEYRQDDREFSLCVS